MTNIWRSIELLGRLLNQRCLHSNRRRDDYSDVPIVMMIDGAHRKYALTDEEGRLAMRQFLHRLWKLQAGFPNTFRMFDARSSQALRRP